MAKQERSPSRRRLDHVKFRVGAGLHPVVNVMINGTDLAKLWRRTGRYVGPVYADLVGPGLRWWSCGDEEVVRVADDACFEARFVPRGYVPVLVCSCGNFGDGGAIARIVFDYDVVTWSDFETVERTKVDTVGPFRFGRGQYEHALAHPSA